ncbi:hypothetical protein N7491_007112 [Penicillium cf. griseofulvum]|uniref:Uncharacterized protein n=1 Tax=Penicillium cf. griseofulvum TaxID=2972120 RepID=A0A9W9M1D4_9EURO|nr:hypothetical protein N7472_009859 [Penicillium cf. griseofulvum]KAJ5430096.1 hypothetical protein N7491_007112 [Penicillium cf. griseofulvum]KAJ5436132.1 hypothetical protein N7445_007017 [Penicillium cf. griseofulvum]
MVGAGYVIPPCRVQMISTTYRRRIRYVGYNGIRGSQTLPAFDVHYRVILSEMMDKTALDHNIAPIWGNKLDEVVDVRTVLLVDH